MSYSFKCPGCGAKIDSEVSQIGSAVACMCGSEPVVPLTTVVPGMVDGDYWIQKKVGAGNISETFVAKHSPSGEKVFMKVYSPACVPSQKLFEALASSMYTWESVDEPGALPVTGYGMIHNHFFTTTPYVVGRWLDELVHEEGALPEKKALKIVLKTARVLRNVWEQNGLLHGNVRPSNILVSDDGGVYIADMGCDKMLLVSGPEAMGQIDFSGTVADYVSPETAKGEGSGPASDVYSLGATLFFALTGQPPYTASDSTQMIRRHLFEKAPDARKSGEVSDKTAKLIKMMMTKDVNSRLGTMRDVMDCGKDLLRGHTRIVETREMQVDNAQSEVATMAEPIAENKAAPEGDNKRGLMIILGVVAFLALAMFVGLIAIVVNHSSSPKIAKAVPPKPAKPPKPEPVAPKPAPMAPVRPKYLRGTMRLAPDGIAEVYLNGRYIGCADQAKKAVVLRVTGIRQGKNILAIRAESRHGRAVLAELQVEGMETIGTDDTWRVASSNFPGWKMPSFDDTDWGLAAVVSKADNELKRIAQISPNSPVTSIWASDKPREVFMRHTFTCVKRTGSLPPRIIPKVAPIGPMVRLLANDYCEIYLNGKYLGKSENYSTPGVFEAKGLVSGKNVLAVRVPNQGGGASLIGELQISGVKHVTDGSWRVATVVPTNWQARSFDDSGWQKAVVKDRSLKKRLKKAGLDGSSSARIIGTEDERVKEMFLRYTFDHQTKEPPTPTGPMVRALMDNGGMIFLNERRVGRCNGISDLQVIPLKNLRKGKNCVAIQVENSGAAGSLLVDLNLGGKIVPSGKDWKMSTTKHDRWGAVDFDDSDWEQPTTYPEELKNSFWQRSRKDVLDRLPEGVPIWTTKRTYKGIVYFRYVFDWPLKKTTAQNRLWLAADDSAEVAVNGKKQGKTGYWKNASSFDLLNLQEGQNVIAVKARNTMGVGGIYAHIRIGQKIIVSDQKWRWSRNRESGWKGTHYDDSSWSQASPANTKTAVFRDETKGFPADSPAIAIWDKDENSLGDVAFRRTFTLKKEGGKLVLDEPADRNPAGK